MYIDLVVLIILLVFVIIYAKRFQTYILGFGIIDILFRILSIIKSFIPYKKAQNFLTSYIPDSITSVINKYTKGVFNTTLLCVYAVIMMIFLYYILRLFIKRRKI